MLFNFGRFGKLTKALIKSVFNNPNSVDETIEPQPGDYLLTAVNAGGQFDVIAVNASGTFNVEVKIN